MDVEVCNYNPWMARSEGSEWVLTSQLTIHTRHWTQCWDTVKGQQQVTARPGYVRPWSSLPQGRCRAHHTPLGDFALLSPPALPSHADRVPCLHDWSLSFLEGRGCHHSVQMFVVGLLQAVKPHWVPCAASCSDGTMTCCCVDGPGIVSVHLLMAICCVWCWA